MSNRRFPDLSGLIPIAAIVIGLAGWGVIELALWVIG